MKTTFLTICTFFSFALLAQQTITSENLRVYDLQTDYETNPLGMDNVRPTFSWKIEAQEKGVRQVAYRLLVASSEELLEKNEGDVWDSGVKESRESTGITFEGVELKSFARYYWKVKVTTNQRVDTKWSETAFFEMGPIRQGDWLAGWINYTGGLPGRVLYYKTTIEPGQKVKMGRIYVSGLGYSELEINHQKVGDHVLDSAQSSYSKRCYYVSYDVTEMLKPEANTVVITTAPGWMGMCKLRFLMRVQLEDGNWIIYTSDNIRTLCGERTLYSTVFDGETYDARNENKELYEPYKPPLLMNKQWALACNADEPTGVMTSQRVDPIRVVDSLSPTTLTALPNGDYIVDAGRNLAGWMRIRVKGKEGQKITMSYAETLHEDGSINQDNLRNAKAEDIFILSGKGIEEWEPRFTYHGFRYVQISGLTSAPAESDLQVRVVRSSVPQTGSFHCSNQLLNDIHQMVVNTESSNLHSVPTDCPQRDERMGWLNDLTVRIEQAMYNFDMSRFYPKFLQDITDTQGEDGTITCVAPFRFGARPADPVCASYLLLANKCYEFYGNKNLILQHFSHLKAWTDYLHSRTRDGIVDYSYYGDWCPPREFLASPLSGVSRDTPGQLISTAYLYHCERVLAQMAGVIGRMEEVARYTKLAEETRDAFNRAYWNEEKGGYGSNNQACNSIALYMGMANEEQAGRAIKNLVADVEAHDFHLTTGNLCTKYLLEVLSDRGYPEVAYRIATQTTYPSWGFMLSKGATTLWERWEYLTGDEMNSHNHPMMGSVGSWFYKYVAGIRSDFNHPAFSQFILQPYPFTELDSAEGELKTVKGTIRSSWRKQNGKFILAIDIPTNTQALVHIPTSSAKSVRESGRSLKGNGQIHLQESSPTEVICLVGSGHYVFESKL